MKDKRQRQIGDKDARRSFFATGWTIRDSNPVDGEIFRTRPDRPGAYTTSCKMDIGAFLRGQSDQSVALTTHQNLTLRLKKG
jgi:hypothetical protein